MIKDVFAFLKNLNFIDYVFFFTVIFLLILVVSLIYFVRINEDNFRKENLIEDPDNLRKITEDIVKNKKPIEFTSYEKEQEDKAIISYDELLENTQELKLNYASEEKKDDDLVVKKFDLNNLVTPVKNSDAPKMEVHLISLAKEEEFLKTLREFERSLF